MSFLASLTGFEVRIYCFSELEIMKLFKQRLNSSRLRKSGKNLLSYQRFYLVSSVMIHSVVILDCRQDGHISKSGEVSK